MYLVVINNIFKENILLANILFCVKYYLIISSLANFNSNCFCP